MNAVRHLGIFCIPVALCLAAGVTNARALRIADVPPVQTMQTEPEAGAPVLDPGGAAAVGFMFLSPFPAPGNVTQDEHPAAPPGTANASDNVRLSPTAGKLSNVPESTSFVLLGTGLAGLALSRKKFKK